MHATGSHMVLNCTKIRAFLNAYNCKGSFGGCQGQPSARPWHLLLRSLGRAALLSSSSVRLLYEGYCLSSLPYRPLPSTPYVIHARLACSLPYTWQYALHILIQHTA